MAPMINFDQGSTNTFDTEIFSMFRFSSGEIVVGGNLTQFNGLNTINGIVRLTSVGRHDRNIANTNGEVVALAL